MQYRAHARTGRNGIGLLLAASLLGVGSLGSAPARSQSSEPIKVGFISELSGPYSFFGTACTQGMKFAEAKINAEGGVLKRPIQFKVVDNQTNPAQAVAAARSLDVQDQVLAFSGPTSSDIALAIYGYAEQNKVPFIVPVAAFPQLTKPGTRYTFRVEPDAVGWGYAIAKFVSERKAGARIAVMYNDLALTRAIVAGLKYQAPKSKVEIVSDVVFPQGSSDATVQAAQVAALRPDYVLVMGVGAFDNTLTSQLLDLGLKPDQLIHHVGQTLSVLGWGKRSIGSFYGSFFDANLDNVTPEGRKFIQDFTESVGRIPSYTENYCYNTPLIIKAAIEKAGVADREKFRDALSGLETAEPTSGVPIEFDKNGARKEYMYFLQIEGLAEKSYTAKKQFYLEWDPEVIPVYDLVK